MRPWCRRCERYAERLYLVKASGRHSTLDRIADAAVTLARRSPASLLVVDYLQKIPVDSAALERETEATTFLAQGLKDLALETGLRIVAIAALDHEGLRQKRMRLADLRGSSALQYEADVGLIFNNKYDIVSREHLVYNERQAPDLQALAGDDGREEPGRPGAGGHGVRTGRCALPADQQGRLCARATDRRPADAGVSCGGKQEETKCRASRSGHITWGLRRAGDERGQAVLETALVSVVLLLLFAGAVDVGRMFYHYIAVTNAAREGARMASRLPCYPDVENSPNAVREAAIAAARNEASNAFGLMLEDADIDVIYESEASVCASAGEPIQVVVSIEYETLLSNVLGFATVPMSSQATMVAFGGDQQEPNP